MVDVIGSIADPTAVLTADTVTFAVAIDKTVARSRSNPVAVSVDTIFVLTLAICVETALTVIPLDIAVEHVARSNSIAVAVAVEVIGSVAEPLLVLNAIIPPST